MPIDTRQYDSAIDFIRDDLKFSRLVANLSNNDDRIRLKSYMLYEDMYHNRPEHIRVTLRGGSGTVPNVSPTGTSPDYVDEDEDSVQIYIPSAKKCIEAVNRFLGVGWRVQPDPGTEQGANAAAVMKTIQDLFKRERMSSKFAQMKRYMLVKGDALLHITADPKRLPGKRISIQELRAEHYFPIEDEQGNYIGCHIVDIINNPNTTLALTTYSGKEVVRRQTYRKEMDEDTGYPTGLITSELAYFETGKWDDRVLPAEDLMLIQQVRDPYYLPKEINQIPVYHWRNMPPPGSFFGTSELSGVESVINAINQAMSDEDLTLIMQGLGVYWTDASPPLDASGNEVEWEISPRSVVQVASGGQFGRVSGITTVQPFGDHINALDEAMQQALAVPDIAIGVVDVTTAESGIALQLKLGPLIAKNQEKELDLIDVADQFIYDLTQGWFVAYEGMDTAGTVIVNAFDDPMPKNKSKDLSDLTTLWTTAGPGAPGGCLPVSWFFEQLNEIMGYKLETTDFEEALSDAKQIMEAMTPPPPPLPPGGDLVGAGAGGAPGTNGQPPGG
jgi:Phage portal protein, SPP1 Gp6-like